MTLLCRSGRLNRRNKGWYLCKFGNGFQIRHILSHATTYGAIFFPCPEFFSAIRAMPSNISMYANTRIRNTDRIFCSSYRTYLTFILIYLSTITTNNFFRYSLMFINVIYPTSTNRAYITSIKYFSTFQASVWHSTILLLTYIPYNSPK